ncbi:hypothetical protein D3C73_408500 [compost metagenome]
MPIVISWRGMIRAGRILQATKKYIIISFLPEPIPLDLKGLTIMESGTRRKNSYVLSSLPPGGHPAGRIPFISLLLVQLFY